MNFLEYCFENFFDFLESVHALFCVIGEWFRDFRIYTGKKFYIGFSDVFGILVFVGCLFIVFWGIVAISSM